MPKDGNISTPPAQTVQPLNIRDVRAPSGTAADNELIRDAEREEAFATSVGTDPDRVFQSLGSIRTSPVFSGTGKDKVQTGTRQDFEVSKSRRKKFEKAQADFAARAGSKATAETISSTTGGGSFQTTGDFGPGGIKIGGVKPLGG